MQVFPDNFTGALNSKIVCSYQGNTFFFLSLGLIFLEKLNLTMNISLSMVFSKSFSLDPVTDKSKSKTFSFLDCSYTNFKFGWVLISSSLKNCYNSFCPWVQGRKYSNIMKPYHWFVFLTIKEICLDFIHKYACIGWCIFSPNNHTQ